MKSSAPALQQALPGKWATVPASGGLSKRDVAGVFVPGGGEGEAAFRHYSDAMALVLQYGTLVDKVTRSCPRCPALMRDALGLGETDRSHARHARAQCSFSHRTPRVLALYLARGQRRCASV